MNKQYRGSQLPYSFSSLNNETVYKCSGSACSCKYLNNRTSHDKTQFDFYNKTNDINYGQNMFKSFKNKK